MHRQDFYFDLPQELIAQYPLANRTDSRLLVFNRQKAQTEHSQFNQLAQWLEPGDLLVLNNTKVIPARFYGKKESGGQVEFLIERIETSHCFLAHIKASKTPRAGIRINLTGGNWQITILEKQNDLYRCSLNGDIFAMLKQIGHIPLPPYITRADEQEDKERYQTVYARNDGSVAAPTAGLHFDENLLNTLKQKGVQIAYLTLHVGAGTFRPLRCEALQDHKMHAERCVIDQTLCDTINQTRAQNKRVIAVGTTSMRSLETAGKSGTMQPFDGDTDIFIYPGYEFKICSGLITNFHLPESTLLMLVSAFIGHQQAMDLYQQAIAHQYRFFSYGDASFLF